MVIILRYMRCYSNKISVLNIHLFIIPFFQQPHLFQIPSMNVTVPK